MANRIYISQVRKLVASTVVEVTAQQLYQGFRQSEIGRHMGFENIDNRYRILPIETWELFLQWSGVDRIKYESEFNDCDDFAYILKGECHRRLKVNGIGLIIDVSGRHAYNALGVILPNKQIRVASIEPQNDRLIIKHEKMYHAKAGIVRF